MKRFLIILSLLGMLLTLSACGADPAAPHVEACYPAAIMADGSIYLFSIAPLPGEIDESEILGYTVSYRDGLPERDGETNFNRELNMPYAGTADGIAVLFENEWRLCIPYESIVKQ